MPLIVSYLDNPDMATHEVARHLINGHMAVCVKCRIRLRVSQFCVGTGAGVDSPLLLLNQLAHAVDTRTSCSLLCVDTTAAFDSLIHLFLFPTTTATHSHDHFLNIISLSKQTDTGTTDLHNAISYMRNHRDSLINQQLPSSLTDMLRDWLPSWAIRPQHW
eukprot:4276544-Amphidinium_carterae.1